MKTKENINLLGAGSYNKRQSSGNLKQILKWDLKSHLKENRSVYIVRYNRRAIQRLIGCSENRLPAKLQQQQELEQRRDSIVGEKIVTQKNTSVLKHFFQSFSHRLLKGQ